MQARRMGSLARIAKLYEAVEQMRSVALQQASAAVSEAENAMSAQRVIATAAGVAGREALHSGDRSEWMMAAAQGDMARFRMGRVEGVRVARTVLKNAALVEFLESRIKTEQMEQVVDAMAQRAEMEEMRRTQAAADDRHLARLRWQAMRDVRRYNVDRVKVS